MTEAARLVDELTTLLYEVVKRWQLQDGRVCEIVVCGACRKKADKPESVVHDSDCPVYRLIRAEAANTAVIRANAEEIADLEDKRDELEAQVNALRARAERAEAALQTMVGVHCNPKCVSVGHFKLCAQARAALAAASEDGGA